MRGSFPEFGFSYTGIKRVSSAKEDEVGIQVSQNCHLGPIIKGTNRIINGNPVNYA